MTQVVDERPTIWQVARRPRWIGVLVIALLVAVVFALLAQWQTARAVEQGQGDDRDTETPVALESVAEPQQAMLSEAGGRMVTVEGTLDPASLLPIAGRLRDGASGWWVTGRVVTADASIAVALGWAATEAEADAAAARLAGEVAPREWLGRYMPTEAPQIGDFETGESAPMSVPALINVWPGFSGDVYAGYLILDEPVGELAPIAHARPITDVQLNWLNIFYAIEWTVFCLFAFYFWFRLVKDAWEREVEELEGAAA